MCGDVVSWGNCGSVGKTRPDLRRPGLVSEASGFGIRTQKPLPKGLAEGGPLGRGFWVRMPIVGASETGPDRQNRRRPPISAPTNDTTTPATVEGKHNHEPNCKSRVLSHNFFE